MPVLASAACVRMCGTAARDAYLFVLNFIGNFDCWVASVGEIY